MRILIAEDDAVSARTLQAFLKIARHTVKVVRDGQTAWSTLVTESFQVVISDWEMPGQDGLELCRKVRARRRKEYLYFILLTAHGGHENHQLAIDAGVDDFLTKPLRQTELFLRLRVADRILNFMNQVGELKRLLPICCYCKKIRDDQDYWHQIESYITAQTGVDFSHGYCPECIEQIVKPQLKSVSLTEPQQKNRHQGSGDETKPHRPFSFGPSGAKRQRYPQADGNDQSQGHHDHEKAK